jgi:RNA polymerase sigma factor (sigma-70 family)
MPGERVSGVLSLVRKVVDGHSIAHWSDAQLLESFRSHRHTVAFTALVHRHGPMVLGVCRRLLTDAHAAEDAFQATFVVLLRKADTLGRCEFLGGWLHQVACRVALKMRGRAARRQAVERQVAEMRELASACEVAWSDLRQVLDEEIGRLPARYRAPLILCYLEGKSNEEAARQLRLPCATLKCQLARARQTLRRRLTRRGLIVSAAGLDAILTEQAAPAAIPAPLLDSLSRAAALAAGATAAETLSPAVLTVVEGVLKTMALSKLKLGLALILAVGLLGGGSWALMAHAGATGFEQAAPPPPPAADQIVQKTNKEPDAKAKADAPQSEAKPKVEALWADLITTNEAKVVRTVLALAATPKETVTFFKDNLRPVKVDARRVTQLIADLESNEFGVRHKAEEQLEYLGKYVRPHLRQALADKPSLDVSKRIDALLKRLPYDPMDEAEDLFAELKKDPKNKAVRDKLIKVLGGSTGNQAYTYAPVVQFGTVAGAAPAPAPAAPAGPSPLWLRAKRAIMVLEHIATPEARELLKALADGEPDALPTKEAKAALERLANPSSARLDIEPEAVPAKETAAPAGTPVITDPFQKSTIIATKPAPTGTR